MGVSVKHILLRKLLHFTGIYLHFVYFTKTSPTAERVMLNELGIPEKNLNIKCDTLKKRNKNKPIFHIS